MARPMVPDDRRRLAASLLEKGLRGEATPDDISRGARSSMPPPERWGSKKGEFSRRDVGGVEKKEGDKKDYEDAVPHLEALVKKWTPKSSEGKDYEKDVLELIKTLGGGKDSDFELTKAEKKKGKGKDWGSKKGEYKRKDVGGVEEKAGDVGGAYKAYEED